MCFFFQATVLRSTACNVFPRDIFPWKEASPFAAYVVCTEREGGGRRGKLELRQNYLFAASNFDEG